MTTGIRKNMQKAFLKTGDHIIKYNHDVQNDHNGY
jgi:hypothetical protein